MTQPNESSLYRWYALDGTDGNDVVIERRGGTYTWRIHDRKYPDPPRMALSRTTPERALKAARRAMKRYRRPFGGAT